MAKISQKTLSAGAIKKKIGAAVIEAGGFREASELWGVEGGTFSASYLRMVVNGPSLPSKKLCMLIGFEPIKEVNCRYRKVK